VTVIELESDEVVNLLPYEAPPTSCIEADEADTIIESEIPFADQWAFLNTEGADILVPNFGAAGVDYHAFGVQNDFITLPSGATAWQLNPDVIDYISIPRGVNVDNVTAVTFEWLFRLNGAGGNNAGRLWSKGQTHNGSFDIYIDDINGCVVIQRGTINNELDVWQTDNGTINIGVYYSLQITWACGIQAGGSAPTVTINNVSKQVNHTNVANPLLWADDSYNAAFIGNTITGQYGLNATMVVFRYFLSIKTPHQLTTEYLADAWRTSDPRNGAVTVNNAPQPSSDPIMTLEKNISNVYAQSDFSTVVTELTARGVGQKPSELKFNNPNWYPPTQALQLMKTNSKSAFFKLPEYYQVYAGYTGDGQALPGTVTIGTGYGTYLSYAPTLQADVEGILKDNPAPPLPPAPYCGWAIGQGNMAGAGITFTTPSAGLRVSDIDFLLYYEPRGSTSSGTNPTQFLVGIYTATKVTLNKNQPEQYSYWTPYQGPIIWYIGDLSMFTPNEWGWYSFPMQSALLPGDKPIAAVISVYPTTGANWNGAFLWVAHTEQYTGTTQPNDNGVGGCMAANPAYSAGSNPNNWIGWPGYYEIEYNGISYYIEYPAMKINIITHDITPDFSQSNDNDNPGRNMKLALSNYNPNDTYYIHFQQAEYIIDWDAYAKFGKVEGTYKNDSLASQQALFNAASQYLSTISQPTFTISISAIDLFDIDPQKNWAEELSIGTTVRVIDPSIPLDFQCIITKITKNNLEQPHDIQIELNNLYTTAARSMANIHATAQTYPKYLSGQTVAAPYATAMYADSNNPATLYFEIKEGATLVPACTVSINPQPAQVVEPINTTTNALGAITNDPDVYIPSTFSMKIDGRQV